MRFNIQEFKDWFPWAPSPCVVMDYDLSAVIDKVYEFDTDLGYVKIICVNDAGIVYVHPDLDCLISETVFMPCVPVPIKTKGEAYPERSVQTVRIVDGLPVGNWEPMNRG